MTGRAIAEDEAEMRARRKRSCGPAHMRFLVKGGT